MLSWEALIPQQRVVPILCNEKAWCSKDNPVQLKTINKHNFKFSAVVAKWPQNTCGDLNLKTSDWQSCIWSRIPLSWLCPQPPAGLIRSAVPPQCSRGPYHTEMSSADKRLLAFLSPLLEWELGLIPSAVSLLQGCIRNACWKKGRKGRKIVGLTWPGPQQLARVLPFSACREAMTVSLESSSPASTSGSRKRGDQ